MGRAAIAGRMLAVPIGTLLACSGGGSGLSDSLSAGSVASSTGVASESTTGSSDPTSSTGGTDGSASGDSSTSTGGESYSFFDSLREGGTMGTALGGSFSPAGWTVVASGDRIVWTLPRVVEGSFEVTMSGVTLEQLPLARHPLVAMYDGGFGIANPIDFNPEFSNNDFRGTIEVFGAADPARVGQQQLGWVMCPAGAPGYVDGPCPCAGSFGAAQFGGSGAWDGTPQRLRIEWSDGTARLLRNDTLVTTVDFSTSAIDFAPEQLVVSLGTPEAEDFAEVGMPLGAVFYDVTIEGTLGDAATCG